MSFFAGIVSDCSQCKEVVKMALARPNQRQALRDLDDDIARMRIRNRVLLLGLLHERDRQMEMEQRHERRARRWWQREWVARRRELGQYHNLFELLDRRFQGDYEKYLRLDRDLFAEVLRRVAPRITKSSRYVQSALIYAL